MSNELANAPMAGLLRDAERSIFGTVDEVLGRALTVGDPLIALEYVQSLQKDSLVKGLAIAKMMYKIKQNWQLFEIAGVQDTFENVVETQNGYAPATVEKYIRMWESIFENDSIPEDIKNQLSGRPIRDLLLLTAAAREGSLNDDDWERVSVAADSQGVREIVRKARGEATSSRSAITIFLQVRDGAYPMGSLYIARDGVRTMIGSLDVESEDDDVKKAIARICNSAHVLEK